MRDAGDLPEATCRYVTPNADDASRDKLRPDHDRSVAPDATLQLLGPSIEAALSAEPLRSLALTDVIVSSKNALEVVLCRAPCVEYPL